MPAAFPDHPHVLTVPRSAAVLPAAAEAERTQICATRAERLARLRPAAAGAPELPPAPNAGALAAFLGEIAGSAHAPAAVLHFHRPAILASERAPATMAAPACDLDRIPGLGPDLIWALGRAGVTRRADLAECAAADLATRLGAIGRLAPVAAWIAQARAAMAAEA